MRTKTEATSRKTPKTPREVASYHHETPASTQVPDERPGHYYVSVVRDRGLSPDYRLLLGPFAEHARALAAVGVVRAEAERLDPRAVWYAFGTCRLEGDLIPGMLNDRPALARLLEV